MSEKRVQGAKRIILYIAAVIAIIIIVWIIFGGMNVFKYYENRVNRIETQSIEE